MKGFSFVGETDSHFEIDHPKDGRVKIAKRALGEEIEDRIRAMPKAKGYADGGVVDQAEPQDETSLFDVFSSNPISDIVARRDGQPMPGQAPASAPEMGPPPTAAPNAPSPTPIQDFFQAAGQKLAPTPAPQTAGDMMPQALPPGLQPIPTTMQPEGATGVPQSPQMDLQKELYQLEEQRNRAVMAAAGAESQAQQRIAEIQAAQQKKLEQQQAYEQHVLAGIDGESDRLAKDYQNGKIDPQRVWNNTSTGNKIIAGIGVLLSGIGSGLTGQPNMAMKIINDTIDRDIDAQKTEQAKKYNLYQFNLRKYGNAQAAFAATKLHMTAMVNSQIAETGAKMGSQTALARAQAQIAENNQRLLPMKMQLAQAIMGQQMVNGGPGGGAQSGAGGYAATTLQQNDMTKDKWVRTIDAGGAKEGGLLITATPKDREEVLKVQHGAEKAKQLMGTIRQFQDHVGRTGWGTEQAAFAESLREQMIPVLQEMNGIQRLTDTELEHLLGPQVPDAGAWRQGPVNGRLKAIDNLIDRNLGTAYSTYGINSYRPSEIKSRPVK